MMQQLAATSGIAFVLKTDQLLKIIDLEGGQVADLVAFRDKNSKEWLSNGRSFDYEKTIYFTTGNIFYSNKSNPMLTIIEDTVKRHDFLYTPCSIEMYHLQYGIKSDHPNCLDNLTNALKTIGQEPREIPTPFNVFMNVEMNLDGSLNVKQPLSKKDDFIVFKAKMDLVIALSTCPAPSCNGGATKPIGYEILSSE